MWTAGIAVATKPTSPTSDRRRALLVLTALVLGRAIAPGAPAYAVTVQELRADEPRRTRLRGRLQRQ